ncbi:MarR family winged helix-turn-helix transcriptional regulator [Thermomonospora umbrina]|uniref:DNA-binding MarR family transcriptional regulator n=1 Tax=Thermomonospora umbrina TaxID=111806 RepID=A0A3D9SQ93_9ACTN|nr:MarR family transcriptional regulator [Thermomonospora umbrina]REE96143.1 DNA-binding MarR family transcriptional regulator [Thermomonospora umbrina]
MTSSAPLDPIAEARRQWLRRWPEHAERMSAITSVMRVQQLLLAEMERALKPFGLTFASYEALVLLHFSRTGRLPLGKMGRRLMVHPTSITNTIDRLQAAGLVRRVPDPADRRRVLAEISEHGHEVALAATEVVHGIEFGLGSLSERDAVTLSALLRQVRRAAGDFGSEVPDPWATNTR